MAIPIPEDFHDDDIPTVKPMPTGMYDLVILQHSWERYRNPAMADKSYLLVEFKVTDGEFDGEKVFARFNLYHSNPKAQFFSWKSLKQLAVATGQNLADKKEIETDDLDGATCKAWIEVGHHEKYGPQYDPKTFYSIDYAPEKVKKPKSEWQTAEVTISDDDALPW